MNIYKEYAGIQRDVTWSDINYTPFANRAVIHAMGKAISGDRDYILQGVTFSKTAGVDASVTAGYVFDQTSGEVVQVEAQTVAETLGTNLWTLVKTTTYDAAGLNNYRTGGPNNNYQEERMVLTNVASIGSGFDVENCNGYNVWRSFDETDCSVYNMGLGVTGISLGTGIFIETAQRGNQATIRITGDIDTDGTYTPGNTLAIQLDTDPGWLIDSAASTLRRRYPLYVQQTGSAPVMGYLVAGNDGSTNNVFYFTLPISNFAASNTYTFLANITVDIQ